MYSIKNLLRIILDAALLTTAFVFATYLRLEGTASNSTSQFIWSEQLPKVLPFVIALKIICLIIWGTYKRFWRYTDLSEIVYTARALALPSLLMLLPRAFSLSPHNKDLYALSFGIILLDYLLSIGLLSSARLARYYMLRRFHLHERKALADTNSPRSTLIIGAGEAARQVCKAISEHPEQGLKIIGALDDDPKKLGMELHRGIVVKGKLDELAHWVINLNIEQLIIAIPSANQELKRKLSLAASNTGLDVRVLPGVDQLAGGKVSVEQIRKLSMEDLLGRAEVDLSAPEVSAYLKHKRVLVTGAGGSIGSEICKQLISKCNISSLCLVGKGENSIFETLQSLPSNNVELIPRIADVRNYSRVLDIVREVKPDVIFHAAAHKHVHLMELNACEAFDNNVMGTYHMAQIAGLAAVESFVLISTDKAVNPTSIMGSTKKLAEKTLLMISQQYPETKYTAVRFGNVLGSRGSVIRVWEQQLRQNLPLTVTHAEAIRYFMTIPEASQLVIQAAAKAHNGEIMVLDMGTPIKIYELAQQFIKLAGFSLEEVPIQIVGLREGEKLYEELLTASEFVESKLTDKIYKAKIDSDLSELEAQLQELKELSAQNNNEKLKKALRPKAVRV